MRKINENEIIGNNGDNITLSQLRDALNDFCEKYPEYKDMQVLGCTECGHVATLFRAPACFAVNKNDKRVYIYSNDDGPYGIDYTFYQ